MIVTEKFYIGYRDVDTNLEITNTAILNIFEDIAGIHASQAGEGYSKQAKITWVLTGYQVKIIKRPEYGQRVTVHTWSTELKNITAAREFEIRDENNNLLVIGLSNWAHINLETKKFEKVDSELAKAYQTENEKTNFNEKKVKKIDEPQSYIYTKPYIVDWNWIDGNNHMNNIYYMELAQMLLPEEIKKQNSLSSFDIIYKKEIKYKDKINCMLAEDDKTYTVVLKNEDLTVTHAIIKLYKNK